MMKSIAGKEPIYLFSKENMPSTPHRDVGEVKWFGMDVEKKYKEQPHPILGLEDIIYRFNCHGYRCPEFEMRYQAQEDAIHVVSVGCSATFGTGLPEDKTYPYVFKELLQDHLGRPVINWNLAMGGAGADYIVRILASALPILKPDIVLLTFTGLPRREYFNENARLFHCGTQRKRKGSLIHLITDPELNAVLNGYHQLASSYNDLTNLFKNYKACEALCHQFEVMWLFSAFDVSIFEGITHLIQTDKLVEPGIMCLRDQYKKKYPDIGLARDWLHPGIQPNRDHAEAFFSCLQEVYSSPLEKLK